MEDIDRIEALVGSLSKGREYDRFWHAGEDVKCKDCHAKAEAALAEAYAVIERMSQSKKIANPS